MRNFAVLLRRELLTLFTGPVSYLTAVLFTFLFSSVFVNQLRESGLAEPTTLFEPLGYLLPIILAPILTMRLFAEEHRSGSLELLMTAPVEDWEVVASKFAGVVLFYAGLLGVTLIHVFVMFRWYGGALDWGGLAAAYLGNFMLAAAFLALGLFCSALFDNQVLAAGLGLTVGLFLLLIGWIVGPEFEQPGMARQLLEFILPVTHYRNFLSGVADTRDLAYFVGFGGFLLFLTVKVVESRKWR